MAGAEWLRDAVIYQIFMPSFADSDGDGIGDIEGVRAHLDHLQWVGVDVIWFNPCFESPFRDAGYDVADYLTVAPRYGTNEQLEALISMARRRGIRVLLDLVAGHTSVDHSWFQVSTNNPVDDPNVWSDRPGPDFVPGPGSRGGYYLKNFFEEQPALNFGYAPGCGGALAQAHRRARAGGQQGRTSGDHGVMAGPRRRRVPRRHGLLAGQGRS